MSRTRLFGTVRQIAREHARATGTITPRLSRRAFLASAGAASAALVLPRRAAGSPRPRVAIIGAGISGLASALSLVDAGIDADVSVYEASNRIGGRMFSSTPAIGGGGYWDENQVTEWCGELIDSGHTVIRDLAQRFGLVLDDLPATAPSGSTTVYFFGGQYYSYAQANADFAPVFTAVKTDLESAIPATKADGTPNDDGTVLWNAITDAGKALDSMSVYDWIESRVPGGHTSNMGKLLDEAYSSEFGADTSEQSALNITLLLGGIGAGDPFVPFGLSDERYHIRGGNQLLPLAIAADLRSRIGTDVVKFSHRLVKIAKSGEDAVTLTFKVIRLGQVFTAENRFDAVILALPFPVLADSVDFTEAGFDARKTTAITELGRGLCSKLQLQFTSRLWNQPGPWGVDNGEETFSDNGAQCSWHVTRGQPGVSGIRNSYTGGAPTVQRANSAPVAFARVNNSTWSAAIGDLATQFLAQSEQIFPGISALYNGKAALSIPHLDSNFKLSYAFWKVGQYQAFAGYERAPQGRIFFAGEHTSVNFQGFMEGGAAEGIRAAQEVETLLSPSRKSGCQCEVAPTERRSSVPAAAIAAGTAALLVARHVTTTSSNE